MKCYLISCNGYKTICEVNVAAFSELTELCCAAEQQDGDGYAVLASHNGRFVADAEGVIPSYDDNAQYRSGYAYACGYRD